MHSNAATASDGGAVALRATVLFFLTACLLVALSCPARATIEAQQGVWRKLDPATDFQKSDAFPFPAMDVAEAEQLARSSGWESVGDHIREEDNRAARERGAAPPLQIRLPMMPGREVQAVPDVRISKSRLDVFAKAEAEAAARAKAQAVQKKAERTDKQDAKKAQETAAACEALLDMRKRQLEAIESDRRTLSALRQALQDMKLTQKLSFMVEQARASDPEALAGAQERKTSTP